MRIAIINGPNLNLVGIREPDVYGDQSMDGFISSLKTKYSNVELIYLQSNLEGEIINFLQAHGFTSDGIILNPGGYTHTSVAIADAVAAIKTQVVEVHISNIQGREEQRHISLISKYCRGTISGLGLDGYELALTWLIRRANQ
ncbi:MAG: type II 3-dehydroquinate dehydratase [Bacteroidota bacterium]|jgi:3-dehydroquinate dehydratase-2